MTDLTSWYTRGRELGCFPDDASAGLYYSAYQSGDVQAVLDELERIFAGPQRMPAVNWLAFESLVTTIETTVEDGPQKFIEDYQPSDFEVRPWGGGPAGGPSLASGSAGWNSLLVDAAQSFLFLAQADKVAQAQAFAAAARSAAQLRPVSLSGLARAATAASFIQAAAPGSPQLQLAVPDWEAVGGLAAGLKARAELVVSSCWDPTIGAYVAGTPPYPLTLYALRASSLVSGVDAVLAAATGAGNKNLMEYLRCLDYS